MRRLLFAIGLIAVLAWGADYAQAQLGGVGGAVGGAGNAVGGAGDAVGGAARQGGNTANRAVRQGGGAVRQGTGAVRQGTDSVRRGAGDGANAARQALRDADRGRPRVSAPGVNVDGDRGRVGVDAGRNRIDADGRVGAGVDRNRIGADVGARARIGDRDFDRFGVGRLDDNQFRNRADNRWRYARYNNQWWYWLPAGYWMFWHGDRWNRYDANTYANYYYDGGGTYQQDVQTPADTDVAKASGPYYEDDRGFYYFDSQGRRVYDPQIRRVAESVGQATGGAIQR